VNAASLIQQWSAAGVSSRDIERAFQTFNAGAPAFRKAVHPDAH